MPTSVPEILEFVLENNVKSVNLIFDDICGAHNTVDVRWSAHISVIGVGVYEK